FFFQAEDGIRDFHVTGVQTCALPILADLSEARSLSYKENGNRFILPADMFDSLSARLSSFSFDAATFAEDMETYYRGAAGEGTEDRKSVVKGKSGVPGGRRSSRGRQE